jgi:hypothetical protein
MQIKLLDNETEIFREIKDICNYYEEQRYTATCIITFEEPKYFNVYYYSNNYTKNDLNFLHPPIEKIKKLAKELSLYVREEELEALCEKALLEYQSKQNNLTLINEEKSVKKNKL